MQTRRLLCLTLLIRRGWASLLGLLWAAALCRTEAATITWTNTAGGLWSQAANWSPHQLPIGYDDVVITQAGTYTVTLDIAATVNTLTLGGASGQQRLTNSANWLAIGVAATNGANGVVDWTGGELRGPGVWQVGSGGVFNWIDGSLGPLTVAAGGVLNLGGTGTKWMYHPLTNWGTVNWTDGALSLGITAIYNQPGALFDAQCDQYLGLVYGTEFFTNRGIFRKSAGTGTTTIQTRFDNTGTVEVQAGTLALSGGGTVGGSYSAAAGSTITLAGNFVQSGLPVFTGAGQKKMTGGALTLTTDVIPGLTLVSGDLWLAPKFQGGGITNLTLAGMTLQGTNTVNGVFNCLSGAVSGPLTVAVGGVMNWGAGNLNGALTVGVGGVLNWASGTLNGALTVGVGGVLNVTGAATGGSTRDLWAPLTNWGTVNWVGGWLRLGRAAIYNQPGALFDAQCDQYLGLVYGTEFFTNRGIFRKSAGTGTTMIQARFDNTGTVEAAKGTIQFSGSYTSTPTSNLRFILSGTTAGTGFGQVRFGTPLVPAGTVSGQVVSGFNPPAGTPFQVIAAGLADVPLFIDRYAGNGYVLDFFSTGDTLTLVTRPGHFTLPPYLSLLYVRPGIYSFLLESQPGLTYRVMSAPELRETPPMVWTPLRTNTTASGLVQLLITNTAAPQQFYRAVTP